MSSWKCILLLLCYRFSVSACVCRPPQLLAVPLLFVSKLRAIAAALYALMATTTVYSNVEAVAAAFLPTVSQPCLESWGLTTWQNKALVSGRSTGNTGGLLNLWVHFYGFRECVNFSPCICPSHHVFWGSVSSFREIFFATLHLLRLHCWFLLPSVFLVWGENICQLDRDPSATAMLLRAIQKLEKDIRYTFSRQGKCCAWAGFPCTRWYFFLEFSQ